MNKRILTFIVNGKKCEVAVAPNSTLAQVIREDLNLTGTKVGCDMGTCGCCTVIADGRPRLACLTLAHEFEGSRIETVESLNDKTMHPIQRAWAECGGSQCGYCTPGFIMTTKHLLDHNPNPSREEMKEALAGNLCRCTGFVKIYDAVERAAKELRTGAPVVVSPAPDEVRV
ncbi:MAG: (2Fe-2S)-binding protein [Planctomycetaceae bacterium]|nr:(2Fe-2S)-binding protein [Planctomycetaceae bacterium]